MAKPLRPIKSGFVIKLSCETSQKLAEEDLQAQNERALAAGDTGGADKQEQLKQAGEDVTKDTISERNVKDSSESDRTLPAEKLGTKVQEEDQSASSGSEDPVSTSDDTNAEAYGDYAPYVTYEGDQAIYTDPTSHTKYTWNKDTNSWEPRPLAGPDQLPDRQYTYENDKHIYTDPDGSKFFYDAEKKAWIPLVDDDFLAYYQMSYGFVENQTTPKESEQKKEEAKKVVKEKKEAAAAAAGVKRKNEPQWFDASDENNTKVYVSNLPQDMTEDEFTELMGKCGLVERDPHTQKMRVKLYMDKEQDCFKGDALCTYIKIESVDLALKLLDGSNVRGNTIRVERAQFQLKGEYNPALKPKKKKKKELEKLKKMKQKLFDWRPEKFAGERSKHERVVIIRNVFHPTDFDKEVGLILDYQADLREECGKAGEVRKVVLYDRHPEGVAQVTMKEPEQADAVVALINGRWFGKRQITAEIWDGRTKYRIAETDADISKRIDGWDKFLEGKEANTGDKDTAASSSTDTPITATDEGASSTDTPIAATDEGATSTDTPIAATDEGASSTDTPIAATDEGASSTDTPIAATDEGASSTDTPIAATDEGACSTDTHL